MSDVQNLHDLYKKAPSEQDSNEWKKRYASDILRLNDEYLIDYYSSTARSKLTIEFRKNEESESGCDLDVVAANVPTAEAFLLIKEMRLILDKKINLLMEAKIHYVAYRYGLLSHMFTTKDMVKGPEAASELVLKLLGKIKLHGMQRCFRISLEHNSDFLVFCCENPPQLTVEQQTLFFLMQNTSIKRKAEIIGVPLPEGYNKIDIVAYHDYLNKHNNDGQMLLTLQELLEHFTQATGETFKSDSLKGGYLVDYIFSDDPHYRRRAGSIHSRYAVKYMNPEVFKLISYIKPFLNNLWDITERSPIKDKFKDPEKRFSKLAGAVHPLKVKSDVTSAFRGELEHPIDHFDPKYDPFYMRTIANKEEEEPLYFLKEEQKHILEYHRLLKSDTPFSQLFSLPIKLKDGSKRDPFAEYEQEIEGSPRLKIVKKLHAYPKRVWNSFFDLVHMTRIVPLPTEVADNNNIWKKLDVENGFYLISLQEEVNLHLFRAIVKDRIDVGVSDSQHKLLHQCAQFLVSLCWAEDAARDTARHCMQSTKLFQNSHLTCEYKRLRDEYLEKSGEEVYPFEDYDKLIDSTRVIIWPVVLFKLRTRYPWLFYGVNNRIFATVGAYHEFADHMFGPHLMEGHLWSVPMGPSLSDYSDSKAPHLQPFITNIFVILRAKFRFGLRADKAEIKKYPYQLKYPKYISWLQGMFNTYRLNSSLKFVYFNKAVRFKAHKKEYKAWMQQDGIAANFLTDPRYILRDYSFDFIGYTKEEYTTFKEKVKMGKDGYPIFLKNKEALAKNAKKVQELEQKKAPVAAIQKLKVEQEVLVARLFKNLEMLKKSGLKHKVVAWTEFKDIDPLCDKALVQLRSAMMYNWRKFFTDDELVNVDFEGVSMSHVNILSPFLAYAFRDLEAREKFLSSKGNLDESNDSTDESNDFNDESNRPLRKQFMKELIHKYSSIFCNMIRNSIKLHGTIKDNCKEVVPAIEAIQTIPAWKSAFYSKFKRKKMSKPIWAKKVIKLGLDVDVGVTRLVDEVLEFIQYYVTDDFDETAICRSDESLQSYHKQIIDTCSEILAKQHVHKSYLLSHQDVKVLKKLEPTLTQIMDDTTLTISERLFKQQEVLLERNLTAEAYESYLAKIERDARTANLPPKSKKYY